MTLQQLEYIVALDRHRNFTQAAEACEVTQSTLSALVRKLEEELDVLLFDRASHPVVPTEIGRKVIDQARVTLYNAAQVPELTRSEKESRTGRIRIGIIPTIAPYLLPPMLEFLLKKHPDVRMEVMEMRTAFTLEKLRKAEIDMAVIATVDKEKDLLEIPLYYEKFEAYVSPSERELYRLAEIRSAALPSKHLWLMSEGHCLRNQVMNLCRMRSDYSSVYEAGSIDTLVRIVDTVRNYTIIPQLHVPFLTDAQKKNLRPLVAPEANREVSLMIRSDYVKEGLLNVAVSAVKSVVPAGMLDEHLKKYTIRI